VLMLPSKLYKQGLVRCRSRALVRRSLEAGVPADLGMRTAARIENPVIVRRLATRLKSMGLSDLPLLFLDVDGSPES